VTARGRRRCLGLAAVLAVGGLLPSGPSAAPAPRVTLKDIAFEPSTIRIKRGAKVTFVWRDRPIEHNVIGRRFKGFGRRFVGFTKGSRTTRAFKQRGTYRYYCSFHSDGRTGMTGRIVVR
jgi:plastocyanin